MGSWGLILNLAANIFTFLSWPSFTIIYPLCLSIWSLERGSSSKNQQCLAYWVLFALIMMVELTLVNLVRWFPFWPCAKAVVTLLLVTTSFAGASRVYKQLSKKIVQNLQILGILLIPQDSNISAADTNRLERRLELEKLAFQGNSDPASCYREVVDHNGKSRSIPKEVQKEWSCVLCLVTFTSEKCMKIHQGGKKHKAKEGKQRADKAMKIANTHRMIFLGNLNQIARTNVEKWSELLAPVTRSITWCKWKKPQVGWTKLNTDGSVDRENAGFGGLLRNHKGDPVVAFVSKAPQDDVFLVELWAIWRGLVLALSLGIKLIWVESDSLPVVKTITREQPYGTKGSRCLNHIWRLLTKFDDYRVTHSWRETNRAADCLSKMVLVESDVVLWPVDFPKGLHDIISDDAQGRSYCRRRLLRFSNKLGIPLP